MFIAPLVAGIVSLIALFAWQFFTERHFAQRKKKYFTAAALPLVLLRNRVYAAAVLRMSFSPHNNKNRNRGEY